MRVGRIGRIGDLCAVDRALAFEHLGKCDRKGTISANLDDLIHGILVVVPAERLLHLKLQLVSVVVIDLLPDLEPDLLFLVWSASEGTKRGRLSDVEVGGRDEQDIAAVADPPAKF